MGPYTVLSVYIRLKPIFLRQPDKDSVNSFNLSQVKPYLTPEERPSPSPAELKDTFCQFK